MNKPLTLIAIHSLQPTFPRRSGLPSAWIIGFWSFSLVLLTITLGVQGAEAGSPSPKADLVAPGIWRIRLGNPEQFTPTHFRSAAMDMMGLEKMAASLSMPLDLDKISFQ